MLQSLLRSCLLLVVISSHTREVEISRGMVRSDRIAATRLGANKTLLVYLPPSYGDPAASTRRYPVGVYLHGRWGDESDWIRLGRLTHSMDSLIAAGMPEMIVAMPDGDDGWWMTWAGRSDMAACRRTPHRHETPDEFCVATPRYDSYVVHDVLPHLDSTYRTMARRESRGIGGLSMGGYGAFAIAARYPEAFAVAVSHSGVLLPGIMPDSGAIARTGRLAWRAGRTEAELRRATAHEWEVMYPMFGRDSLTWRERDPAVLLVALKASGKPMPLLYADIALGDERLEQNRTFREAMAAHGIPLRYAEWSGKHSWRYFQEHTPEGLRFLSEHLAR